MLKRAILGWLLWVAISGPYGVMGLPSLVKGNNNRPSELGLNGSDKVLALIAGDGLHDGGLHDGGLHDGGLHDGGLLGPAEAGGQQQDMQGDHEERSLAHSNCFGLAAEMIASDSESLLSLLRSEDGRRAAKDAALRSLLANATSERAAALLQNNRGISICGNSWLDWIPWLPCRVQSPPPRPPFQDEERGGDGEGPLCRPLDY